MKQSMILFLSLIIAGWSMAVTPIPPSRIEVYYFHYTKRDKTCLKVEEVAKNTVLTLYPVKVKRGEIFFKSVNLDEKEGAALGAKLKIKKKTLIVILADKRIDLTKQGNKYACDFPEKLNEAIKNAVESIVK